MEDLLKQHKDIKLSGASASHKNGKAERTIKTVATIVRTTLMHSVIICPKETLSTGFCLCQCTIIYESTIVSLIYSMGYQLLIHGQEQFLIHFW